MAAREGAVATAGGYAPEITPRMNSGSRPLAIAGGSRSFDELFWELERDG